MGKKDKNEILESFEDIENDYEKEVSDKELNNEANDGSVNLDDVNLLKVKLDEEHRKSDEYLNILQRTKAEFDNYKKRTAKEKDSIYSDAVSDTVSNMLDVLDNLERAIEACKGSVESGKLIEGVEMVFKQFKDTIEKMGVHAIKAVGEKFNPELHNAVMHIEDENAGENEIIEEFQKGYKMGDKVIRHSMVKVAN